MFGGDVDKAIGDFRRATQLDPSQTRHSCGFPLTKRKKGDNEGANEAMRQALRLNPRSVFGITLRNTVRECVAHSKTLPH